jgi:hypothetical protein
VSALVGRRWLLYNALVAALEYRVAHKLLFGTDFPFFSARETIDGLRSLTGEPFGPGLPRIDEGVIEEIVHRPSLELLELR